MAQSARISRAKLEPDAKLGIERGEGLGEKTPDNFDNSNLK